MIYKRILPLIAGLLMTATSIADLIEIDMTQSVSSQQILSGQATTTWRYTGSMVSGPETTLSIIPNSYLGPVINVSTGDEIKVHMQNNLAYETTTHWHGLDIPEAADGHPKDAFPPGASYDYEFIVRNRAGTYWYHPHPDMMTGEQVYRGLASFFIVSDPAEQALDLPRGEYDLPICIQDGTFNSSNQWTYSPSMNGFIGNTTLVNGQKDFTVSAATRIYRLRVLNGSQTRILKLSFLDNSIPMVVIGVDGGLLEAPREYPYVMLGPGERVELWADFSNKEVGDSVGLRTLAFSDSAGPSQGEFETLMNFTIDRNEEETLVLPTTLVPMGEIYNAADVVVSKTYPISFMMMDFMLNGSLFSMLYTAPNEEAHGNDLEMVTITNTSGMMLQAHPIHFHGRQFQIYSRSVSSAGASAYETVQDGLVDDGWKDTFIIMPYETVKFLVRWSRYPGLFVYHCHNLPHEDMGMMRNFRLDEPLCPSDLNHDNVVNVADLLAVIGAYNTPFGDITGDSRTNVSDILSLIGDWGACDVGFRNLPIERIPRMSIPSN